VTVVTGTSALGAAEVLSTWEQAAGRHPIDAALAVLELGLPGMAADSLAGLPLGRRDALLLAVRRATLGDRLEATGACPACGGVIEVAVSCDRLLDGLEDPPAAWTLDVDGYRLRLRPLDSHDAARAAMAPDVDQARAALLVAAVIDAEHDGRPVRADELPPAVADAVDGSLAAHDPGAEILLGLTCDACGHAWAEVLDVASTVTAEIQARATRLLRDVHVLARAYGWREPEILALSDARRSAYLAMAGA
jgi:hypothetical protein